MRMEVLRRSKLAASCLLPAHPIKDWARLRPPPHAREAAEAQVDGALEVRRIQMELL